MLVPTRHEDSGKYRYGFQGQEKDDEVKGEGNSLNYKYRMHDSRIGRFFAVDPLTKDYPHYTPYSFSGNKLIAFRELEGMEEEIAIWNRTKGDWDRKNKSQMAIEDWNVIVEKQYVQAVTYFLKGQIVLYGNKEMMKGGVKNEGVLYIKDQTWVYDAIDKGYEEFTREDLLKKDLRKFRTAARNMSTAADIASGGAVAITVVSEGLSAPLTVPIATAAELQGAQFDFISVVIDLYIGDYNELSTDGVNLVVPFGLNKFFKKLHVPEEPVHNLVKTTIVESSKPISTTVLNATIMDDHVDDDGSDQEQKSNP